MALTDEKGNSVIFETVTNKWTEELGRAVTMSCGGSVSISLYVMDGATMKQYAVKNIVTRSQQLGKAIRTVKDHADLLPEEAFSRPAKALNCSRAKFRMSCGKPTAPSTWGILSWMESVNTVDNGQRSPFKTKTSPQW